MTEIFGVLNPGQRPLTPGELEPVRQFFADHYPPATIQCWQQGPVALGSRLQSGNEAPPAAWPTIRHCGDGDLAITASVRLDNRAELATSLTLPANVRAGISDEELILLAYQKWGPQCPAHLLGDFAFAIWDGPRRRLFCARDHMGIKPFYFACEDQRFVFASDPQGVTAHPGVPDTVSDLAVARYLGEGDLYDDRLTFHQAVQKLPPATSLLIDDHGISEQRYWQPENAPDIRHPREQDYIEQLQQLLVGAVAARLPAEGPVGAHLSGGIDSSGIVAIAAEQLRGSGRTLHTWSWMRPPRTPEEEEHPEWGLGQRVADLAGTRHRYTELDRASTLKILQTDLLRANDTADLWYEVPVREEARSNNVRFLLSGWGGDQLISHHGYYRHAETFWRGRFISTLRDMWEEAALARNPARRFLGMCYRGLVLPVLPARLSGRSHAADVSRLAFLGCTTESFQFWAAKQQRKLEPYSGNCIRHDQLASIKQNLISGRVDSWAISGGRQGLEYRYPLLDRRLVEFAIGMPPEMYRSHGQDRYAYRSALKRWLPEDICHANTKVELQRVAESYETTRLAVRDWLGAGINASNDYIAAEKLAGYIRSLPPLESGLREENILKLIAVGCAIFVTNM